MRSRLDVIKRILNEMGVYEYKMAIIIQSIIGGYKMKLHKKYSIQKMLNTFQKIFTLMKKWQNNFNELSYWNL